MKIDFNEMKELTLPCMNEGVGMMTVKMYRDEERKAIMTSIHPKGKIGLHKHTTSDDINYVLSGKGIAVCDNEIEMLSPNVIHICKKGSEHSIENTGDEDLVLLTIVVEK